jgi:hypothetical protein
MNCSAENRGRSNPTRTSPTKSRNPTFRSHDAECPMWGMTFLTLHSVSLALRYLALFALSLNVFVIWRMSRQAKQSKFETLDLRLHAWRDIFTSHLSPTRSSAEENSVDRVHPAAFGVRRA